MQEPREGSPHQADKLLQRPAHASHPQTHGTALPQETAVAIPRPGNAPPWIAVGGGKGGVGKTTISVNLALMLQRAGHRVLLVDLDPGLPNVDVLLRLPAPYCLEDVALGHVPAQLALQEGPHGLQVLTGRSGSDWLAEGGRQAAQQAIEAIGTAARDFDIVLVDTGAGIGSAVLAAAVRADLVMAITTPDPASITDAYALCKVLQRAGRPLPHLVVNHVRDRDHALTTVARLGRVTQQFLGQTVPHAGWLRRDPLVERAGVDQRALALHGSGPVMEDLRALAAGALSALPRLPRRSGRRRNSHTQPAGAGGGSPRGTSGPGVAASSSAARDGGNPGGGPEARRAAHKAEAARRLLRRRESS